MIYITKNTTNKVVLTLTESSTLVNPFYLFAFKNEFNLNSETIYWTQLDDSVNTNRYNLFTLVESSSGSTTGGTETELNLVAGQYKYWVYESTGQTLSISATTGSVLESGRLVVAGEENTTITNNPTNSIYI